MIILELTGGLGNQLFQYATGRKLALRAGTGLLFDTRYYRSDPDRRFSLDAFENEGRVASVPELKLIKSTVSARLQRFVPFEFHHPTIEDQPGLSIDALLGRKRLNLRGYFADTRYFAGTIPALRKGLPLKKSAETPEYQDMLRRVHETNSVAVHVRRGDYASNAKNRAFFEDLRADYYTRARQLIDARSRAPVYYVFTDDVVWVKKNLSLATAPDSVVVADHFASSDYHDFDLMRRCRHSIIANSTFSWWAAVLSPQQGQIVVQPRTWYRNPELQRLYDARSLLDIPGAVRL